MQVLLLARFVAPLPAQVSNFDHHLFVFWWSRARMRLVFIGNLDYYGRIDVKSGPHQFSSSP
jgi:hypothetical protein